MGFLAWDEEKKKILVKSNLIENKYLSEDNQEIRLDFCYITNFDPTKSPILGEWKIGNLALNEYSATLLKMLNWPKELLLIFGTQDEASICLKGIFPNPALVKAENIQ